jgi:hypothetical protein
MQQPWLTRLLNVTVNHGVMSLTTDRVHVETWPAVSLLRWNTAEGETGMTEICSTPSTAKMHAAGLKTGARSMSMLNRSDVTKGTMTTMVPFMTNSPTALSRRRMQSRRSQSLFPQLKKGAVAPEFQAIRNLVV